MSVISLEYVLMEGLRPSFTELMFDNVYWMDYDEALDVVEMMLKTECKDDFVRDINFVMNVYQNKKGKLDAYTDVALTLEEYIPEKYSGRFSYY